MGLENNMKPITFAAGILILAFSAYASAEGNGVLRSAGLSPLEAAMPDVPMPDSDRSQALPEDFDPFSYFGYSEAPEASMLMMEKGMKGVQDTVFSRKLDTIMNLYLKPAVSFTTGKGTRVYVSGTKAANCPDGGNSCKDKEKFFLVLTTGRNESFFVRAMDILNWGFFMKGSRTVTIDGEKYVVKVYAKASDAAQSKLEIKGPRGVALSTTLQKVGDAVAARGVDVKLGKNYKLAYGNEIVQGPQGGKFTRNMLVLLIPYPVVDASTYYIFKTSDIRPAGVSFPSFEKGYGFRLENGVLEIYRI